MPAMPSSPLAEFHRFVGDILQADKVSLISPEEVLARWREEQETLQAIREGLADIEAGRTVSLQEFDQEFRQRHGIQTAW